MLPFNLGIGAPSTGVDIGDNVANSLMTDSTASQYLSKTFGTPTTQNTFTFVWLGKRGKLGAALNLLGVSTNNSIGFNSSDQLVVTLAGSATITSSGSYRDPAAHMMVVYRQTTGAAYLEVNGVQIGTSATVSAVFNTAAAHQFGAANTAGYFDGYSALVYFIDGQTLASSNFGRTSAQTGAWVNKNWTGTFGANGFLLNFSNSGSLGTDSSGNGNNWTLNGGIVAGNQYTDTPTNNYCVMNVINKSSTVTGTAGNLTVATTSASNPNAVGSIATPAGTGKWYWEVTPISGGTNFGIGIATANASVAVNLWATAQAWFYYAGGTGWRYSNSAHSAYGANYVTTNVISVAFDATTGNLYFALNGQWANGSGSSNQAWGGAVAAYTGLASQTYVPLVSDSSTETWGYTFNFGAKAFTYTPPTGFVALCTANLPTPAIMKPNLYFDAVTYTGNGSTQTVSLPNASLKPDLVWVRNRNTTTSSKLTDSTRGVQLGLISSSTGAQTSDTNGLTAFNSGSFALGTDTNYNNNAATYVAWNWAKNNTPGFGIVGYTGTGANATIAHTLGVAPSMVITKDYTAASTNNWAVWHTSLTSNVYYCLMNTTAAQASGATYWNSTTPTSSNFYVGSAADTNTNAHTYVAYLFAPVAGFSAFGSFVGNASADGTFVYCGFRPRFIMTKCITTTGSWTQFDALRPGYNPEGGEVWADLTTAESTTALIDITSNGFKCRATTDPNSAQTFIYMAFAAAPFKFSTAF